MSQKMFKCAEYIAYVYESVTLIMKEIISVSYFILG